SKMILGYWNFRGMGEQIRLMLEYLGLEYEDVKYYQVLRKDNTADLSNWLDEKYKLGLNFPNLPYLIDKDVKLTESMAIMKYLANKGGLMPETEEEHIRCDIFQGFMIDFRKTFRDLCSNPDFNILKQKFQQNLDIKLRQIDTFFGCHEWMAGKRLTWIDFYFFETFDVIQMCFPESVDGHPRIKHHREIFLTLQPISEYRKSNRFIKYPVRGVRAVWGSARS
uniref:glutathione transferase n=1 Tax=Ciona intestinalis TaxID=7719 RepID=H2XQD9_CIOIN